jgi:hypothetical protein
LHFGLQHEPECKAIALHLICVAAIDLRRAMQTNEQV